MIYSDQWFMKFQRELLRKKKGLDEIRYFSFNLVALLMIFE